jgi:hypothetical protein
MGESLPTGLPLSGEGAPLLQKEEEGKEAV